VVAGHVFGLRLAWNHFSYHHDVLVLLDGHFRLKLLVVHTDKGVCEEFGVLVWIIVGEFVVVGCDQDRGDCVDEVEVSLCGQHHEVY